jgi:MoaA/NifB/PqqE/SkfB family radical SAM enzyme
MATDDPTDLARLLRRHGIAQQPAAGVSDRVGEIYVMLTWRCNLRCRMCPMWGDHGFCVGRGAGPETLTVDAVEAFCRDAASFGPRTVTLSGGEPLLSELCLPLAHRLAALGLRVMLTTNATLLPEVAAAELASFHQINLSIDGPPLVLERLGRGGSSTLERALAGIEQVARVPGRAPALQLLTVITSHGVGHLVEMLDRFAQAGVSFSRLLFQHQMFLSVEAASAQRAALEALVGPCIPIWEAMVSPQGTLDVDLLLAEMVAIRRRFPQAVFSPDLSADELRRYYADGAWIPPRYGRHCPSPWLDVGLAPNGDVWLCPGAALGNIQHATFAELFNGPEARRVRRAIATAGVFPGCRGCFYLYNYQAS